LLLPQWIRPESAEGRWYRPSADAALKGLLRDPDLLALYDLAVASKLSGGGPASELMFLVRKDLSLRSVAGGWSISRAPAVDLVAP